MSVDFWGIDGRGRRVGGTVTRDECCMCSQGVPGWGADFAAVDVSVLAGHADAGCQTCHCKGTGSVKAGSVAAKVADPSPIARIQGEGGWRVSLRSGDVYLWADGTSQVSGGIRPTDKLEAVKTAVAMVVASGRAW